MTDFFTTKVRQARKGHLCDWCLEPIVAGAVYKASFGVEGRDAWAWKAHLECDRALERELHELGDWECVTSGERHLRGCTMSETQTKHLRVELDPLLFTCSVDRQAWPCDTIKNWEY